MNHNTTFNLIRASRKVVTNVVSELTVAQLNLIPISFKNNIIWNIGHLIASEQTLCYMKAGQIPVLKETFIEKFKPGTKPDGFVDKIACDAIIAKLLPQVDRLEQDYRQGLFKEYQWFESKNYPGLTICSIEDALQFLAFHEGLHLGYVMAMKHLIL